MAARRWEGVMCYLDSKAVGFDVNYCTGPRILCMKWEGEYQFEQCMEGDALPRLYQIWKCKESHVLFLVSRVICDPSYQFVISRRILITAYIIIANCIT